MADDRVPRVHFQGLQRVFFERLEDDTLPSLLLDLFDPSPCELDHHGYCQAHGWMEECVPCPQKRLREVLEQAEQYCINRWGPNWFNS